jgi:hypothetical protein
MQEPMGPDYRIDDAGDDESRGPTPNVTSQPINRSISSCVVSHYLSWSLYTLLRLLSTPACHFCQRTAGLALSDPQRVEVEAERGN